MRDVHLVCGLMRYGCRGGWGNGRLVLDGGTDLEDILPR